MRKRDAIRAAHRAGDQHRREELRMSAQIAKDIRRLKENSGERRYRRHLWWRILDRGQPHEAEAEKQNAKCANGQTGPDSADDEINHRQPQHGHNYSDDHQRNTREHQIRRATTFRFTFNIRRWRRLKLLIWIHDLYPLEKLEDGETAFRPCRKPAR